MATSDSPVVSAMDLTAEEKAFEAGFGFPCAWYTDPAIFAIERALIHKRSWQYLAPLSWLSEPGSVFVSQIGDVSVIVTRDATKRIYGFVNMCRHRGYPLVARKCSASALVCEYHGWSYRLNGSLRSAPGADASLGFDAAACGLIPIAVDFWGEMIFGNLSGSSKRLADVHPELEASANENGVDPLFNGYRFHSRLTYEIEANWKVFYDNDVECYHCPTIHRTSFNAAYLTQSGDFVRYQSASGQLLGHRFRPRPLTQRTPLEKDFRSEKYGSIRAFPGFTVAQQDDIALVTQIAPTGVEHTKYVADFFAETGADDARVDSWLALWDQTFREDAAACARQQQSIRTGMLERTRIVASQEPGVIWARDNIWQQLKHRFEQQGSQRSPTNVPLSGTDS